MLRRNLTAFWLLGLCNNFAYVIMLSAAKDILEKGSGEHEEHKCNTTLSHRECAPLSTGSVLLADIIPSLVIKIITPVALASMPFDIRHVFVVLLQAGSFVMVAVSSTAGWALTGVVLASLGSGFGEVSYLALSAHFPTEVVTAWSSGTGGAGIFGALAYAALTDERLLAFRPRTALLTMLVVPVIFAATFWLLLRPPRSVQRVDIRNPRTFWNTSKVYGPANVHREEEEVRGDEARPLVTDYTDSDDAEETVSFANTSTKQKLALMAPLFKYMIPLSLVYFAEYFINQGLLELLVFDCSHGFGLAASAQYRWFQVLYQLGVFISRSIGGMLPLPSVACLAALQLINAGVLTFGAVRLSLLPHFGVIALLVLYEGLLGGFSYVHTFRTMHKEIPSSHREFSLGFVSISDTFGILFAGIAAIPTHNAICALPLM